MQNKFAIFFVIFFSGFTMQICNAQTWDEWNQKLVTAYRAGNLTDAIKYGEEAKKAANKEFGKIHKNYALACNNLALMYASNRNQKQAETLYLESKDVWEQVEGKHSPNYATCCYNLGTLYTETFDYINAEKYLIEAKNLREELFGNDHKDYATCCNNLAELYREQNKFELAEPLYIECKRITENTKGKNNTGYAVICNNLGILYLNKAQYDKAELFLSEALTIFEQTEGKLTSSYAECSGNLALLYQNTGQYEKAEPLFVESKNMKAEKLGKSHPDYALSCNNLAGLYKSKGNYREAEQLYIEAKNIYAAEYGTSNVKYSVCLNNLAGLYKDVGNFNKAELFYLEVMQIYKNNKDKNSSQYAAACNNLSGLYEQIGNYAKAEELAIEAKTTFYAVYGKSHPDYASSCNNLAVISEKQGDYEQAEELYIEADDIKMKIYGDSHESLAVGNNNLAFFYLKSGKYLKAEIRFNRAKKIYEQNYGKNHYTYALSCNNLAYLYALMKDYERAEQFGLESVRVYKQLFGEKHPDYVMATINLALTYMKTKQHEKALNLFTEVNDGVRFLSEETSKYMSESERELYFNHKIYNYLDASNSFFLVTVNSEKNKNTTLIYDNVLHTKGQLLKSKTAVRKSIAESGDTVLIALYSELNDLGKSIAGQYALPLSERHPDLSLMEEKANSLEKLLVRASADFAKTNNASKVNWQDIKNSLKSDETAIEFIAFRYHNSHKWSDSVLYFALILRKEFTEPKAVFLFEEKQLNSITKRNTEMSEYEYIKKLYDPKSSKADSLYKLLWQPLELHLTDIKTVYLSPARLLNTISFAAVPMDSAHIVSDSYRLIYTGSTAEVLNHSSFKTDDIERAVLFGGLEYEIEPTELKHLSDAFYRSVGKEHDANDGIAPPVFVPLKTRGVTWAYLPGSLEETQKIQKIFSKNKIETILYTAKEGTEECFKALENQPPTVLHVSSHGFYFGADSKSEQYKLLINKDVSFAYSDNPLRRSGFVLSGGHNAFNGNELPLGVEDGVLTAEEVSQLNLFKTKLVVLSACQTGLGETAEHDGIYGLRRAFKTAGVEYLIFSLWEVPDKQTEELMTDFYNLWNEGRDIRDAFIAAQENLKIKYAHVPGSAFAWAAFVLMR